MPSMPKSSLDQLRLPLDDLSGGVRSDVSTLQIPPGSCQPGSKNIYWTSGYLQPRPGMLNTFCASEATSGEIVSVIVSREYSLASNGYVDALSRIRKSSGTYTYEKETGRNPQTWASPTIAPGCFTLPKGVPHFSWDNFAGKTYVAGFQELIEISPSTGAALVHSFQSVNSLKPPQYPSIVVAGDQRLFLADCYDRMEGAYIPSRIYWSGSILPRVWRGGPGGGTSGYIDLPRNTKRITGVVASTAGLMVFTDNEVYFGYYAGIPLGYVFRGFINGVGCSSHETIKPYRDGSYIWLGGDNVYIGVPGQSPVAIGDKIRLRLREVCDESRLRESFAVLDMERNLYHLFVPSSSSPNGLLVGFTLNIRQGSWWENEFVFPIKCGASIQLGLWDNRFLLGSTDSRVFDFNKEASLDISTPFPVDFTSGAITARTITGGACEMASFQWARLHSLHNDVDPQQLDYTFWATIGLDNWTGQSSVDLQVVDGTPNKVSSSARIQGEHFCLQLSSSDARNFPPTSKIDLGFIPLAGVR